MIKPCIFFVLLLNLHAVAYAETDFTDSGPSSLVATPYRPTVSNPAQLSVPKYLEIEVGWNLSRDDVIKGKSLQYLSKYAFNENWAVLLGGGAWTSARSLGDTESGLGDTFLLLKHLFASDSESHKFGMEMGLTFPTAKSNLGSNQSDFLLNGIYSVNFLENWKLDANLGLTQLGKSSNNEGNTVTQWVSCFGYSKRSVGVALEFSGTHQSSVANTKKVLVAVSYSINPRLVLDMAYSQMRQDTNAEYSVSVGSTWLVSEMF